MRHFIRFLTSSLILLSIGIAAPLPAQTAQQQGTGNAPAAGNQAKPATRRPPSPNDAGAPVDHADGFGRALAYAGITAPAALLDSGDESVFADQHGDTPSSSRTLATVVFLSATAINS